MGGKGAGPSSVVSHPGDSSRVQMMAVNRGGGDVEEGGGGGGEAAKGVAPGGGGTGTRAAGEPIPRLGGGDRSLRLTGPPL